MSAQESNHKSVSTLFSPPTNPLIERTDTPIADTPSERDLTFGNLNNFSFVGGGAC